MRYPLRRLGAIRPIRQTSGMAEGTWTAAERKKVLAALDEAISAAQTVTLEEDFLRQGWTSEAAERFAHGSKKSDIGSKADGPPQERTKSTWACGSTTKAFPLRGGRFEASLSTSSQGARRSASLTCRGPAPKRRDGVRFNGSQR